MRSSRQRNPILADHQSPLRGRWLDAEAEKAQRTDEDGGVASSHSKLDQQHPRGVGKEFPPDDGPGRLASRPGYGDVVTGHQIQRHGACHTACAGQVHQSHHPDQHEEVAGHSQTNSRDRQQGKDEHRDADKHLKYAHHDPVKPTADKPTEQPQKAPQDDGQ